jgi:histidyl-tRNA synthetase
MLEGLFKEYDITDPIKLKKAIKIIDNMEKVSIEETTTLLLSLGLTEKNANKIKIFFDICQTSKIELVVSALQNLKVKNELFQQGLNELVFVIDNIMSFSVPQEYFMIDPSIARGLDYYTGTVYETVLLDFPYLGSVCSGGRYDNLVRTLSGDNDIKFPGCGISIGLTRLIPELIRKGYYKGTDISLTPVLIAVQDQKYITVYNKISTMLRESGIGTSVYYDGGRLKQQIEYAATYGYKFLLIGREELEENKIQIKEINSSKENIFVDINDVCGYIKQNLTDNLKMVVQKSVNKRTFNNLQKETVLENLQNLLQF